MHSDYTQPLRGRQATAAARREPSSAGQSLPRLLVANTVCMVEVAKTAACYTRLVPRTMSWQRTSSRLQFIRPLAVALLAASSLSIAPGFAQSITAVEDTSPAALVSAAVANEMAAAKNTTVKHMFSDRKQTPRGSQTKLYLETTEAMAGLLIANDDKPVSTDQMQNELNHLQHLVADHDDLRRKARQEHEDAEHTLRIVKALPDAFLYEFDGAEPSQPNLGKPGDELLRLKFRPNPHYSPPSRVEQVLMGMQGYLLIDKAARRIARIDGTLFREVSFGWGILGHLDKGGSFLVDQADVGDGTWQITHMRLNFTGKIMLVKNFTVRTEETFCDFRRVPDDTSFAKGVELLKAEQARLRGEIPSRVEASKNLH
jgi:hypothetical protein